MKLTDQARESARAAGIARVRYREGVADFLTLLDAERTQLQAEDGVAQAEAGVFRSPWPSTRRSAGSASEDVVTQHLVPLSRFTDEAVTAGRGAHDDPRKRPSAHARLTRQII